MAAPVNFFATPTAHHRLLDDYRIIFLSWHMRVSQKSRKHRAPVRRRSVTKSAGATLKIVCAEYIDDVSLYVMIHEGFVGRVVGVRSLDGILDYLDGRKSTTRTL
jgi:hypothetical protein